MSGIADSIEYVVRQVGSADVLGTWVVKDESECLDMTYADLMERIPELANCPISTDTIQITYAEDESI